LNGGNLRNFLSYFIIFLFVFIGSCSRHSAPDKVPANDIEPLEVKYFIENPTSIKKIEQRNEIMSRLIKNYLDTMGFSKIVKDTYRVDYLQSLFKTLYEKNNYQLLWNAEYKPSEELKELIGYVKNVRNIGLEPDDYNYSHMESLIDKAYVEGVLHDVLPLIKLDLCASSSAIVLASHLNAGKISPDKIDSAWFVNPPKLDYAKYVSKALNEGSIQESFTDLQPNVKYYWDLAKKLKEYRKLQKNGGLPSIPNASRVANGDTAKFVLPIKKLLAMTGDLEQNFAENDEMTTNFKDALRQYQMRMDQDVTGNLNEATIEAMRVPLDQRIETIGLNMERLRWFEKFEQEYIVINVPQFKMRLIENEEEVISMKTVVGKEYDATPMFSDMLEYIVFNPHWTVPYSIASEEMLPKIKADPGYLPRNNYKLLDGWGRNANEVDPYQVNWSNISKDNFSYVIEQQSGSFNALGAVKFMFPNDNSIYMHDTPAEYLFEKDDRDYSHGCIRLENPFELAEYLLRNKSGWDQQKQQEVMSKEEPVNVYLPEPIPVHIVYLTSWVDKYGNLNFRNDIYGHDTAQKRAIEIKEEAL
jgi:L,D-transpeptidase YcbB